MNTRPTDPALWPSYLYVALIVKYTLLIGYGVTAATVGIPTLVDVAGHWYAYFWPAAIAALSLFALVGTIRSWMGRSSTVEWVATFLLIVLLAGYTAAIIYRASTEPDSVRIVYAWFPVILSVFPAVRIFVITAGGVRRALRPTAG